MAEQQQCLEETANATYEAALERSKKLEADIAAHPERHRVLTGDRPTGRLHIGAMPALIHLPITIHPPLPRLRVS